MNACQIIQPPQQQQQTESPKQVDIPVLPESKLTSQPMENMDMDTAAAATDPISVMSPSKDESLLKKKKKKTSYKSMIAAMTTSDAPRDTEKEKDSIRKATGGGVFAKIDKI
jgi:hypothetical protein